MVGKTYGVAECTGTGLVGNGCELCAVKVLSSSGSGSLSGVIAGINFVTANCGNPKYGPFTKKCVANMSLGAPGVQSALNDAVNNAVNDFGVVMAVAAGNDNDDACGYSPAAAEDAITVGSTNNGDARSSFSNYGSCVDVWAPGRGITSAWTGSNTATKTISGTSMASPRTLVFASLVFFHLKTRLIKFCCLSYYLLSYSDIAGIAAGLLGSGMATSPAQVLQKMNQRSVLIDIDVSTADVDLATAIGDCKGATISPAPTPPPDVLVPYTEHFQESTVGKASNPHSNCVNNKGKSGGAVSHIIKGMSGTVTVSTCYPRTDHDTVMHIYDVNGNCVAGSDDASGCGGSSRATFNAKENNEYFVYTE